MHDTSIAVDSEQPALPGHPAPGSSYDGLGKYKSEKAIQLKKMIQWITASTSIFSPGARNTF